MNDKHLKVHQEVLVSRNSDEERTTAVPVVPGPATAGTGVCYRGRGREVGLKPMADNKIQVAFQTRMGEELVKMTSTLVETVSINYEDFNESFLTCGTCLCTFNGADHIPKLLPCSHTVCLHCLGRIVACNNNNSSTTSTPQSSSSVFVSPLSSNNVTESPKFRCPICRELITIPRGGVAALPPSFLVNQLLDLMASQRREVVPKCSTHSNQELLFCETCDSVFCSSCVISPHSSLKSSQVADHTVIPFSIAIKRMSEILLYKANECLTKLDEASVSVNDEMKRLSSAADVACEVANKAFEDAALLLEKRRANYIASIHQVAAVKKEKLKEQLDLIEKERAAVRATCDGLEYQVEVRHITKRISELASQLDSFISLRHPRENAYLLCKTESDLTSLESAVSTNIQTSTTFPPLCTLTLAPDSNLTVGLEVELLLETRDYHNKFRKEGGDPVQVTVTSPDSSPFPNNRIIVHDNEDGMYVIKFTPTLVGAYQVDVQIFGRPIKDSGMKLEFSEHNNPSKIWGKEELCQPVSVAKHDNGDLFILDTGNGRIVVLDQNLLMKRALKNETLEGRSCTGLAYCAKSDNLLVVNWRTKQVTRMSGKDGTTIGNFTHSEFVEPIGISVDSNGNIYVVDNGVRTIFVFESQGVLKSKIHRDKFELLGGVAVSADGKTVVIGDMSLFVIDNTDGAQRQPDKEIKVNGSKGRFGGVTIDSEGNIIATRTEKGRSCVQIYKETKLISTIDSFNSKLKRPSDLAVISSNNILVIDLGNDCIKQYRYK